ncbi:hypothetical protein [Marinimicrobium sp. C2-29]|uniref:hypothetical protein n=1 Tax=Marinimicrobium sp. C2-29 TaxID=3139825 RepID=UPI003139FFAC
MQTPDFRPLPLKTLAALLLGLTLTACGGGDSGSRLDGINDDGAVGGANGNGEADNEPAQLGRGSADDFVAGEIELGIGNDTMLTPGGSTTLSVTMVNNAGELITNSVDVNFNSDCISSGAATLTDTDEEGGNSVSTNNGRATVTYNTNGCAGDDQVTARATYEGLEAGSARATITVEGDTVQTLEFIGAEPDLISLKGTGGLETSKVTFQVKGVTGSPMRDVEVQFALSPSGTGGLALVNTDDTSNGSGEVSTTVQAGNTPTSVRVTATTVTDVGDISTQSSELVVSTGIPDQNSATLSATDLHPVGWRYDGVESQLTMRLADAFNNPAPDGTAVTFTTSGGSVDSSCTTQDGACSVTWRSQNPRPEPSQGFNVTEEPMGVFCPTGLPANTAGEPSCRPGRVRILATTQGNESFIDNNGNGLYDHASDIFLSDNSEGQCDPNRPLSYADVDVNGCDDLGTAYLDKNFNRDYDSDEEIVVLSPDEGSNGSTYQPGDGIYNGVLCSDASRDAGDCNRDSVTVRDDIMLVMSCDVPYVMEDGDLPGTRDVVLGPGQSDTVTMLLADCNGNGMPAGTVVSLNDQAANNVQTAVFPDGELAGSSEPSTIGVSITAGDDKAASGTVHVIVTAPTPGGELISYPASIGISAPPPE